MILRGQVLKNPVLFRVNCISGFFTKYTSATIFSSVWTESTSKKSKYTFLGLSGVIKLWARVLKAIGATGTLHPVKVVADFRVIPSAQLLEVAITRWRARSIVDAEVIDGYISGDAISNRSFEYDLKRPILHQPKTKSSPRAVCT